MTLNELKAERNRLSWLCQVMRPPPPGTWERVVELEAQIAEARIPDARLVIPDFLNRLERG